MARGSEFNPNTTPTGIARPTDPDGRPGHDPSADEEMRLMYQTGQPPGEQDPMAKPDPVYFAGQEPLPPRLRKPKYANDRPGGYVEE